MLDFIPYVDNTIFGQHTLYYWRWNSDCNYVTGKYNSDVVKYLDYISRLKVCLDSIYSEINNPKIIHTANCLSKYNNVNKCNNTEGSNLKSRYPSEATPSRLQSGYTQ